MLQFFQEIVRYSSESRYTPQRILLRKNSFQTNSSFLSFIRQRNGGLALRNQPYLPFPARLLRGNDR